MDPLGALQSFLLLPQEAFRSFVAYFGFHTRDLLTLSTKGDLESKAKLTTTLFVIACLSIFVVYALCNVEISGPLDIVRNEIRAILISTASYAPVALLFARNNGGWFVPNVVLINHAGLGLAVGISTLVLFSLEPARTDFGLLGDGIGRGTVAYEMQCGNLERLAEVTALNIKAEQRTARNLERGERTLSWMEWNLKNLPPAGRTPSPDELRKALPMVLRHFEEVEADAIAVRTEAKDMAAERLTALRLNALHESVEQDYLVTYPTVEYAKIAFFVVAGALFVMTMVHVVRAGLLIKQGLRQRLLLFAAILLTVGTTAGTGYFAARAEEYPSYDRKLDVGTAINAISAHPPQTLRDGIELQKKANEITQAFLASAHIANRNFANWLKSQYHAREHICPKLPNHGLWARLEGVQVVG